MKLETILKNNSKIVNERKKQIYPLENIFNNTKNKIINPINVQNNYEKENTLDLIEYKENIFTKILNSIRKFLKH